MGYMVSGGPHATVEMACQKQRWQGSTGRDRRLAACRGGAGGHDCKRTAAIAQGAWPPVGQRGVAWRPIPCTSSCLFHMTLMNTRWIALRSSSHAHTP